MSGTEDLQDVLQRLADGFFRDMRDISRRMNRPDGSVNLDELPLIHQDIRHWINQLEACQAKVGFLLEQARNETQHLLFRMTAELARRVETVEAGSRVARTPAGQPGQPNGQTSHKAVESQPQIDAAQEYYRKKREEDLEKAKEALARQETINTGLGKVSAARMKGLDAQRAQAAKRWNK